MLDVGASTIALVDSGRSSMRNKTSYWSNENVVPRETDFVRKECDSNGDWFEWVYRIVNILAFNSRDRKGCLGTNQNNVTSPKPSHRHSERNTHSSSAPPASLVPA